MKKEILLLLFACCTIYSRVPAQTPFPGIDSVDINNINASVALHGDMWWDPAMSTPKCNFPNGSQKAANFISSLWMSGYDDASQLHVAAQTYRQDGNDWWPGPLSATGSLPYHTSGNWAQIWKVYRSDIQYFRTLASHDVANTPESILTWPGAGNSYTRGTDGAMLFMLPGRQYAPFTDLNGDGIYQPLLGEYPDIKGDMALWWVFSDNGPSHGQSNGRPMGVEVQAMSYAYRRSGLINNVVYYDYKVINRSANNYHDMRIALNSDVNLGYRLDDYIGFDSGYRLGIAYNSNNDDGAFSGYPELSYGNSMPMSGVTIINAPGDAGGSYVPAGSFVYFNNDFSVIGNPVADTQYNNYMRAKIKDGRHYTNDFTGAGSRSVGYGAGPNTNYVYTGNPFINTEWSECAANNFAGERMFVLSTGDFSLAAGASQRVTLGLVVTPLDTGNGCPNARFPGIKALADTAWHYWYNPPPQLPAAVTPAPPAPVLHIYPNPTQGMLYIANTARIEPAEIALRNALGQYMPIAFTSTGNTLSAAISSLPPGLYTISIITAGTVVSKSFVKQ